MTPEMAHRAEQTTREHQADQRDEAWGFDQLELAELVKRWGTKQILITLAQIHQQLTSDGSTVEWRILSTAYQQGGYDSPDPCPCDNEF